ASNGRQKFTKNTITDPIDLRNELSLTRQRGFALDHGETSEFRSCVGAPIFDYRARAIAAISVATTVEDVSRRSPELASIVVATARAISDHFGYRSSADSPLVGAIPPDPGTIPPNPGAPADNR
ncbi:MAG: IclR family transcriptional regulator C-terminal domain-containing protein, partial [Candidatus Limnocylindrales bacterium]